MRWTGFIIPIALASTAFAQQNALVIDDFDSAINDAVGGPRALSSAVLANPFSQLTEFGVSPSYTFGLVTGAAVFNSGIAAVQTGSLSYDHNGAGLGLDASGLGGFELDFLQANLDFTISVELMSFDTGGSASWSGLVNATQTGETLSIAFDQFGTSGEFNLSSLDSISIELNAGESPVSSLSFVLTEFRTEGIVPSPASAALLGLSGLVAGRRRRL